MENSEKEINQQQIIQKEETDASAARENFFTQSIKFDQTKIYLKKIGNYYINNLFSLRKIYSIIFFISSAKIISSVKALLGTLIFQAHTNILIRFNSDVLKIFNRPMISYKFIPHTLVKILVVC